MKIKKSLAKYLFTLLLCSTILIPKITVTNQSSYPAETATPYSDMPSLNIKI